MFIYLDRAKTIAVIISLMITTLVLTSCSQLEEKPAQNNAQSEISQTDKVQKIETQSPEQATPSKKVVKLANPKLTPAVKKYCREIDRKFLNLGWGVSSCRKQNWHHVRDSYLGRPLLWVTHGNEQEHKVERKSMTLVMCGVHGDEITPIKFCFDLMDKFDYSQEKFKDKLIVIAPIVNPDSFFKKRPTRTNARGVDLNRNFPTKDWYAKALKLWKTRYRSDKRRYPGKKPLSEPATLFQVNLIKRYKPDKVISVHAPLTMLDYDGPGENHAHNGHSQLANQLLIQMSKKAAGYKIRNYPFFPGSLGNWAGNERNIPTYTLELPSSDNRKTNDYWNLFKDAILHAFEQDLSSAEIELAKNNK